MLINWLKLSTAIFYLGSYKDRNLSKRSVLGPICRRCVYKNRHWPSARLVSVSIIPMGYGTTSRWCMVSSPAGEHGHYVAHDISSG